MRSRNGKIFLGLMMLSAVLVLMSCQQPHEEKNEHPEELVGKWVLQSPKNLFPAHNPNYYTVSLELQADGKVIHKYKQGENGEEANEIIYWYINIDTGDLRLLKFPDEVPGVPAVASGEYSVSGNKLYYYGKEFTKQ